MEKNGEIGLTNRLTSGVWTDVQISKRRIRRPKSVRIYGTVGNDAIVEWISKIIGPGGHALTVNTGAIHNRLDQSKQR